MLTESRRDELKKIGLGAASTMAATTGLFANESPEKAKKHLITFSFDDGFKKSSIRTAEIFEKYELSACINVIASAHRPDFEMPNEFHRWPVGDFGLWNELKARGHEIMMHGFRHANKAEMPLDKAKDLILRCIDVFSKELKGFDVKESIFNFPYNASTPALEEWLATQVKAYRTGGAFINPLPHKGQVKLTSSAFGPEVIDKQIIAEVDKLLAQPSGWLICTLHGLDDEGWGPMTSGFLDQLLQRLTAIKTVQIGPPGKALAGF
jgi:peptidoglycan/xylan/chitin deacetylase (PgdA/CDA1 family)